MEQPFDRTAKPAVDAAPPAKTAMTTGQAPPHPDSQPLSPSVVAVLLARGNELLATGDVVAARLMYERAARSYSGPAAIAMGMTYDPRFLAQIGAQGIAPDPQRAAIWYRHAADLGSAEAAQLLAQLPTASGH
jgi:TPR repeat protein